MTSTWKQLALATLTVGAFWVGLPTAVEAHAQPLPVCQEEDGNIDGKPCNWTDPDTGAVYYVTSENYR
ncbi:Uncharacterised protein [Mycobacteroides abscessus subsp. massiliense]|uniref:hypothetical protein n=1 Tax=Mycobacteroides abscessus TaxID=36809 RepID=UPI0009A7A6D1|nr:hypothetical protein [Mycobacteroides abscessus]SKD59306.1 Uncharacterised protein [Mycobacteroides abscessus subsp. massiliense]SKH38993.1 Uncharacterised protein [Mycobacteroides abscessus subsp. massiliense]SKH89832.1 Uncharacterised protein [Mycobacteroides abscessus subsp. massiliense]SKK83594.1 Uncharacterised protein [Mycobacteroides abscessus subsp. massiliense]SKK90008.1 Uncharacterised protein [Mycobacteroides abscessus subsp. massiliense]